MLDAIGQQLEVGDYVAHVIIHRGVPVPEIVRKQITWIEAIDDSDLMISGMTLDSKWFEVRPSSVIKVHETEHETYAYKCPVHPTTTRTVLDSEKDEQYCGRTHLGGLTSPMRRLRLIGGKL